MNNKLVLRNANLLHAMIVLIAFLFFLLSFINTFTDVNKFNKSPFVTLSFFVGLLILSIILTYLLKSIKQRYFIYLLLIVGGGIRLAWILNVETAPVSDFLIMYQGAQSAAKGDFSLFSTAPYFVRWPYQIGFTLYQALLIKVFGNSLIVLKLFNVLISSATAVVVFFIAKNLFNDICGKIASLLYVFYVPLIIMCSVLTNQHLSTFLYTLGIYFAIRPTRKYNWIYIGLCFGFGNLIRPMGSFYIGILFLYVVYLFLIPFFKNMRGIWVKTGLGVLAVFFIVQHIFSFVCSISGITSYPLSNKEPYWKFVVGLNASTNGKYSQDDNKYVSQFKLGKERDKAELLLVKERLHDKEQLLKLFSTKFVMMWGGGDSSTYWSVKNTDQESWIKYLDRAERILYLLLLGLGCISMGYFIIRNNFENIPMLLIMIILGYAALHLVIEVQTRYRHDILPFMFVVSSVGLKIMIQRISSFSAILKVKMSKSSGLNG
ncbi:dolichyl-phosphate-mannose-protein mannosyltransferase [Paenibacillus sp. 32O-W]|uniref:ArnT family glycosyltransferase n=1 Tax=Paenibacillus sp. 32O-W TaxID=1695218 RepID=UPI00071F3EE7|nr:glycosyltransferase family 39 protein [Paenibacillus sp. 32O-W]ALS25944.1 dolichyl-phosphate-mannose-protein mannosyltransferase [Paenibacillus sp. 32O-W]